MPTYRAGGYFMDAVGRRCRVSFWVTEANIPTAASSADSIMNTVYPMSHANLFAGVGVYYRSTSPLAYGGTGFYQTAQDKAVLLWQDAQGAVHRMPIPAPVNSIFYADLETVDPASALVAAWASAMGTYNGTGPYGDAFQQVIGGYRIRRRMPRRITFGLLTPALGGPA